MRGNDHWMNRVALSPESREHVESFFIKANDPAARRAIWLKLTLFSSREQRYGETWAILFDAEKGRHPAVKQRFGMERVESDPERPGLAVDECTITDSGSSGAVRDAGIRVAWRLALEDELPPYRHFPARAMYDSALLSSKICTPHPSARFTGEVELWSDGAEQAAPERIALDGWRGMQGHNWGKRHADRYAWCHCNLFDEVGPPSFFEAFAAQVRVAGLLAPPLSLGRLVLAGRTYRFDTWRNLVPVRTEIAPTRWRLALSGPDGDLAGTVTSNPSDTVGLHYPNPNGEMSYCLNSKLSRLELELRPRHGAAQRLTSDRAALEVTQHDPRHGIRMVL